jgi:hypothetical protein
MREERNPYRKRGERNIFCSEYNHCLDIAIAKSWNSWNCNKCKSRFNSAVAEDRMTITTECINSYECTVSLASFEWSPSDYDSYCEVEYTSH